MGFEPLGFRLEAARTKPAGSHPSDLVGDDQPGPLQNLNVLLHAGQRHLEPVGETGDRGVGQTKLIDDPTAGRIRQRRKRTIDRKIDILNHVVQF